MPNYNSSVKDMHDAYLLTCKMKLPIGQRCRILTEILVSHPKAWQVVGTTPDALDIFAQNDFKYVARMGIQRAHLRDRADLYTEMLNDPILDRDYWWDYYLDNDRTVFATKKENMSGLDLESVHWFNANGLFKLSGYAWRHRSEETDFLKNLHEEVVVT